MKLRVATCLAVAIALACGLAYLYRHDPSGNFYPKCLFHSLTGLWCPGCGLTRGLYACLHGDYAMAVRMNALMFVVMPVLSVVVSVARRIDTVMSVGNAAGIICLLFLFLRNIPCWPFVLLSPS